MCLNPDHPVYATVVDAFGSSILLENSEINRPALAREIYFDATKRKILNGLMHPTIFRQVCQWMEEQSNKGLSVVVLVPLLFEAGWTEGWDATVCVSSPLPQIMERLKKRGLDPQLATASVHAQWPLEKKEQRADFTIQNDTSLSNLHIQTERVLETIRKENTLHD